MEMKARRESYAIMLVHILLCLDVDSKMPIHCKSVNCSIICCIV